MAKIDLLEFFKTGKFGDVEIGMSREEVEKRLGKPDSFLPGLSNTPDKYETAALWVYGGVEFSFSLEDNTLQEIYFKPFYLSSPQKGEMEIETWLFGTYEGPTKKQFEVRSVRTFNHLPGYRTRNAYLQQGNKKLASS